MRLQLALGVKTRAEAERVDGVVRVSPLMQLDDGGDPEESESSVTELPRFNGGFGDTSSSLLAKRSSKKSKSNISMFKISCGHNAWTWSGFTLSRGSVIAKLIVPKVSYCCFYGAFME
jgi:hypothetical protein